MASTKSTETLDREVSQARAKRTTVAEMRKLLRSADAVNAKLREELAAAKEEISRKERVINVYAAQLKAARAKLAGQPSDKPLSERRAAMQAAREEAMRTGSTVAVSL